MKKIIPSLLFLFVIFGFSSQAADNQAPDFSLPTVDGEVKLSDLEGKVVYLDFWASWCLPCKKSFPWMVEMNNKYAEQGLVILAVNLDKDRALADEFLEEMSVNFTVAFDASGDIAAAYKLKGMPSSYLIGRDGVVNASHIGFRDKDKEKLEQAIKTLLEK